MTLAGLIGYRGVARILVEDRAIGNFPLWFNELGQQALIGPLTLSILIFVMLFVFFAILLHASAFGRLVYVVGSNIEAARYSGVRVGRVKTAMFVGSASWRRSREFCMLRDWDPCAATWRTVSNSTSSRPCCWEGSAFSEARAIWSALACRSSLILNLRNGMGLADITGNTQNYVIGGLLILSVLVPNIYQEIQNKWKGRER